MKKSKKRAWVILLAVLIGLIAVLYIAQTWWAHLGRDFEPGTPQDISSILEKNMLEKEDYIRIFEQTGLGSSAVKLLRAQGKNGEQKILNYQQAFFAKYKRQCTPLFGWFVKEDVLVDENNQTVQSPPVLSLREGDILISLSTHSVGWTHGHAAIAIDKDTVLQSRVIGENSNFSQVDEWRRYENYVVVRVKDASLQERHAVANFAEADLYDVPYRMTAGLFGGKDKPVSSVSFGTQCAYLVWYAWNNFGVDLDYNQGKLVTPQDILRSDEIEIVQMYGLNPAQFTDKI